MKKCPRCAELVQDEALVCRYCQHKLGRSTGEKISSFFGVLLIIVGLLLIAKCSSEISKEPEAAHTSARFTISQITECENLLNSALESGLIMEWPNKGRINVNDIRWAAFPASSKRGIMLALACTRYQHPLEASEYVVAYGYRSGRRVAMATSVGVTFD